MDKMIVDRLKALKRNRLSDRAHIQIVQQESERKQNNKSLKRAKIFISDRTLCTVFGVRKKREKKPLKMIKYGYENTMATFETGVTLALSTEHEARHCLRLF